MESHPRSVEQSVFDSNFKIMAVHFEDKRMLGVEVAVVRGDRTYVLTVETFDHYTAKTADGDLSASEQPDPTLVIGASEITVEDLSVIKSKPLDELQPYLVAQA